MGVDVKNLTASASGTYSRKSSKSAHSSLDYTNRELIGASYSDYRAEIKAALVIQRNLDKKKLASMAAIGQGKRREERMQGLIKRRNEDYIPYFISISTMIPNFFSKTYKDILEDMINLRKDAEAEMAVVKDQLEDVEKRIKALKVERDECGRASVKLVNDGLEHSSDINPAVADLRDFEGLL